MGKYKWIILFLLAFSLLQAEDIYTITIDTENIINASAFKKDFKIYLEKDLANSGRILLGGYYKDVQDADDLKIVNHKIDIKFIHNGTNYESVVKVINLNIATVEFLLSVPFSYNEILQPVYCAHQISEKILNKIRVISIIVDRNGSDYILDVGENLKIRKGDRFTVYEASDTGNKGTVIAQLEVVAVQKERSVAKIISQREDVNYGAICVLESKGLPNVSKDCTKIFIPAIIQSGHECSLFIESTPSGCDIYLNNCKYRQTTPTRIKRLNPGLINISLYKQGYQTYQEEIQLVEGVEIEKAITLEKKISYGRLEVNSEPQGAQIYLNEEVIGQTPFVISSVKTGYFKLTVKKRGYKTRIVNSRIRENEKKKFSFILEEVSSEPSVKMCENSTARKYIAAAIRQFKNKKSIRAIKALKRAYAADKSCPFVFYIKGLIEWIELNQKKKAERSLDKARQLGFKYNKETPYPDSLDLNGIVRVLNSLEKRFQLSNIR